MTFNYILFVILEKMELKNKGQIKTLAICCYLVPIQPSAR